MSTSQRQHLRVLPAFSARGGRLARGFTVTAVAGELMVAVVVPGTTTAAFAFAMYGAAMVLVAAEWPRSPIAGLAVLGPAAALATGHPSPAQGWAAGALALVFLAVVEARCSSVHHATPTGWLSTHCTLLLGGVVGCATAVFANLPRGGLIGLTIAGVLLVGAGYLIARRLFCPDDPVVRK